MNFKDFFQSFWGGVITVGLLGGLIILFINLVRAPKGPMVEFSIEGPQTVRSGETNIFKLLITNNSRTPLNNAEIELKLPEGVSVEDLAQENQTTINYFLGEIEARKQTEKTINLLITGLPKTSKIIEAVLRYRSGSVTATFEIPTKISVGIQESAFVLNIDVPKEIFTGQLVPLDIRWENQTNNTFDNVFLKAEWPTGFIFQEANPPTIPESLNDTWLLGNISPQSSGKIQVKSLITGQPGEMKKITLTLETKLNNKDYPLAQKATFITLTNNPLEVLTLINNELNYNADLGETLNVVLTFKNNYSSALRNLVVKTTLNGDALDYSSLKAPKAVYNTRLHSLVWDGLKVNEIYSLTPGETSSLTFSINLKQNWPMSSETQKNPVIEIRTEVQSSNIPENIQISELPKAISISNVKINTEAQISIESYFKEITTTLFNKGKLPLRVGEPTEFTIHWKLTNSYNTINNVIVKTSLPLWVEFTTLVAGNYQNAPKYDPSTRQIIWQLPSVPAGAGYLTEAPELVFQIRVTPTANFVNQPIPLIEKTILTARDSFTSKEIIQEHPAVMSDRLTDKSVSYLETIVQP